MFRLNKNTIVKTVAVALVSVVAVGLVPSQQFNINAKTTSSIQSEIAQLEKEQKALEAEKNKINSQISTEEEKQETYVAEINNVRTQLDLYQQQIADIDAQIAEKNTSIENKTAEIEQKQIELEQKQAELDEAYEVFKERLDIMYMSSTDNSIFALVFGATSFADFLTLTETMKSISESDNALMEKIGAQMFELEELTKALEGQVEALKDEKEAIEVDKKELEAAKASFQAKSDELNSLFAASQQMASDLKEAKSEVDQKWSKTEIEIGNSQDELTALLEQAEKDRLEQAGSTTTTPSTPSTSNPSTSSPAPSTPAPSTPAPAPSSKEFIWPVNGGYISSPYGPRWGTFHYGVDIAAPSGTAIYAAKSGTVIRVQSITYGYGKNITISHGDGTYTMYAHCSAMYVSTGQHVSQGQVIAAVGTTGSSTGNHLHFEIRRGSSKYDSVNPANYIC